MTTPLARRAAAVGAISLALSAGAATRATAAPRFLGPPVRNPHVTTHRPQPGYEFAVLAGSRERIWQL